MEKRKMSHSIGGRLIGSFLILLNLALIIGLIATLIYTDADFMALIVPIIGTVLLTGLLFKILPTFFTTLTFKEDGIVSQYFSDTAELSLDDIKGIWLIKKSGTPGEIKDVEMYTPTSTPSTKDTVLFGNIQEFDNARGTLVGGAISGEIVLTDTFTYNYTTIAYRKSLIPILNYYYQKTQEHSEKLTQ